MVTPAEEMLTDSNYSWDHSTSDGDKSLLPVHSLLPRYTLRRWLGQEGRGEGGGALERKAVYCESKISCTKNHTVLLTVKKSVQNFKTLRFRGTRAEM